eukprot:TRINITY_DN5731_c0_g6_i1.p1 TRINITY_DN5731_c0_g6~~TRINITY_DN5731_c0_g6_i1.p1  ORF type:complete len:344 (+),score=65.50 TRINITY_DN5731_c0_g6_i1:43-1074(+)
MEEESNTTMGTCSVCLGGLLAVRGDTLATTKCGHVYHFNCILQSLEYMKKCPNCNAKLCEETLHKIAPSYLQNEEREAVSTNPETYNEGDIAEFKRTIHTLEGHVKRLKIELKTADDTLKNHKTEIEKYKDKLFTVHNKLVTSTRDNAGLWDNIKSSDREIEQLHEIITRGRYKERLEGTSAEDIADEVFTADDTVKNNYIKDLVSLLKTEKQKVDAATTEAALLQEDVHRYKSKAMKYKRAQCKDTKPSLKRSIAEAESRLEVRSLAPALQLEPPSTPLPEGLAMERHPSSKRKKSLISNTPVEGFEASAFKPGERYDFEREVKQTSAPVLRQGKLARYMAK